MVTTWDEGEGGVAEGPELKPQACTGPIFTGPRMRLPFCDHPRERIVTLVGERLLLMQYYNVVWKPAVRFFDAVRVNRARFVIYAKWF